PSNDDGKNKIGLLRKWFICILLPVLTEHTPNPSSAGRPTYVNNTCTDEDHVWTRNIINCRRAQPKQLNSHKWYINIEHKYIAVNDAATCSVSQTPRVNSNF
ncbi:hypothetical protein L9F63_028350, partial [Diploptera punctata]